MGVDRTSDLLEAFSTSSGAGDLECPICLDLCSQAVAGPCGHTFCLLCATRATRRSRCCPLCRQPCSPEVLEPQRTVRSRVDGLLVACERGCGWRGRCDERQAHWSVCPVAQATEFEVQLSGEAGWMLNVTGGQLMLMGLVESGAASMLNHELGQSSRRIRAGCVVIEVSGMRGDSRGLLDLLKIAAKHQEKYTVVLRRPTEFCTTITRHQAKSYGLELGIHEPGSCLTILSIQPDGAVMEHNCSNVQESLKSQDKIVQVNGLSGTSRELMLLMQSSQRCTVTICRPPPC